MENHPSIQQEAEFRRPSFRRRLLTTVGPALVGALGMLALVAWGAVYVVVHHNAVETLETEIGEMRADARIVGDSLHLDGYAWDEAHHRLAIDRVDPIFVQVFNARNRLVRASGNIDSLRVAYPDRLLAARTPSPVFPTLRTFEAGGRTLYYLTRPLTDADGTTRGFVQVARVMPEHRAWLESFGWGLAGLWILLSGGLVALVGWAAGRVLRPLRSITTVAQSVTSADLDTRVEVSAGADRETATLARTFNALLDRVEEHVDMLRAFTANAAHELQTPLTVLRGHVEIALRRDRSAESYRETLQLLDGKLGELVRTLRALLTLTRLDRDGTLDREPVDLATLAADEVRSFHEPAHEKGVTLSVETGDDAWVSGQPDLLRETVRNLVDNAVKYTPEGEIRVSVARNGPNAVQLTCADTGRGMDADEREQITRRFYRGTEADQVAPGGSGLGLSLVQRIVEKHDGTIDVASTPGEGTRFTVTLPAVERDGRA
jgi:signal transduction histidine kinase